VSSPDEVGTDLGDCFLPACCPHLGTLHGNGEGEEDHQRHHGEAGVVVHPADRLALHPLLREDVPEDECEVGDHCPHESYMGRARQIQYFFLSNDAVQTSE
jgi:hypothetical protein